MSFSTIRSSIVGLVAPAFSTAYPDVGIAYDNSPFDWANPPQVFAFFEVEFHDGAQANIAVMPRTRYHGFAYVTVYSRSGTGTKTALEILDWFRQALAYQSPGLVRLREARPDSQPRDLSGYHQVCLKVPFHADGD